MIKSICQNPFHGVIARSLLHRNRWCNVICQISLFSKSHVSQKWSIGLNYHTTLHLLWSKWSSFWSDNIACHRKDSLTLAACHWDCKNSFHFYFLLHLIKVLFANKSFITIVLSLFTQGNEWEGWTWPMMMRTVVVVTMIMMKIGENYVIWPANEAETKIPKNPGKISEKSRD